MTAAFELRPQPTTLAPASGARRPLFDVWPGLERDFGFLPLGVFPTPVEHVPALCGPAQVYLKRDDLSSPVYGGNLTSAARLLRLARRATTWLFERTRDKVFDLPRSELARGLEVDGSQLGAGYGYPSAAGVEAIDMLSAVPLTLDTTYSAKSAAALLARSRRGPGTILYWCTKSSAPLPVVSSERLARAPRRMLAWLGRGRLEHTPQLVSSSRARPSPSV